MIINEKSREYHMLHNRKMLCYVRDMLLLKEVREKLEILESSVSHWYEGMNIEEKLIADLIIKSGVGLTEILDFQENVKKNKERKFSLYDYIY